MTENNTERDWDSIRQDFKHTHISLSKFCKEKGLPYPLTRYHCYEEDWFGERKRFKQKLVRKADEKIIAKVSKQWERLYDTWDLMRMAIEKNLRDEEDGSALPLKPYALKDLSIALDNVTTNQRLIMEEHTKKVLFEGTLVGLMDDEVKDDPNDNEESHGTSQDQGGHS